MVGEVPAVEMSSTNNNNYQDNVQRRINIILKYAPTILSYVNKKKSVIALLRVIFTYGPK